ncbi:MAG: RNA-binding S4 domain-containing protein [Lachnospiraceae bacterium]|nr:RNA-binding S4 domain-containing protein [Lachnospiraceae bacterium]
MRLDKFLKVSRIIKRRTVANEACDAGRVSLNGRAARASADVKEGDTIEVRFGTRVLTVEVVTVVESIHKEDAAEMYRVISEERIQPAEKPENTENNGNL